MSDDTIRVRVRRGEFRHDREHYTRDDELEVPERTLERHPHTLERVEKSDADDELDERAVDLADENYQTVVSAVESGEADAFLDDLEQADDRDSVQNAISERQDELEG